MDGLLSAVIAGIVVAANTSTITFRAACVSIVVCLLLLILCAFGRMKAKKLYEFICNRRVSPQT